jgi:transcription elongation factor GreA
METDSRKPYYVSEEGLEKLKEKLGYLKNTERKNVADRLKEAVESGDITDSPSYELARETQALIEGRITELGDLVKRAVIIKKRQNSKTVAIGSSAQLRQGAKKLVFSIVGSEETDPEKGLISNESPLGQALLGKKVGDEVIMTNLLGKKIRYKIVKIF